MKKFLLVGFSVLALALILSACMNVGGSSNVISIKTAISAAASGSTSPATVEGIVTYGYKDYVVIQDNTGAIEVYAKNSNFASLYVRGDRLRTSGTIEKFNGNWELKPASTSDVVKIGSGTVTSINLPTDTALGENYDWMLVKVENLPVKKIADKYDNVVLSNGTQDVTIYSFDGDVKNWLSSLATGDKVSVQGIVEEHYGVWKIILRDMNDKF